MIKTLFKNVIHLLEIVSIQKRNIGFKKEKRSISELLILEQPSGREG